MNEMHSLRNKYKYTNDGAIVQYFEEAKATVMSGRRNFYK